MGDFVCRLGYWPRPPSQLGDPLCKRYAVGRYYGDPRNPTIALQPFSCLWTIAASGSISLRYNRSLSSFTRVTIFYHSDHLLAVGRDPNHSTKCRMLFNTSAVTRDFYPLWLSGVPSSSNCRWHVTATPTFRSPLLRRYGWLPVGPTMMIHFGPWLSLIYREVVINWPLD